MEAIKFAEVGIKLAPEGLSRSALSGMVRGFWTEPRRRTYKSAAKEVDLKKHYEDAAKIAGLSTIYGDAAAMAGLTEPTGAYGRHWVD